jgi:hypothetical protein
MTKRDRYLREAREYDAKAEATAEDDTVASEHYSRAASGQESGHVMWKVGR